MPDLKVLKVELDVVPSYRGMNFPPKGPNMTKEEKRKVDAWEKFRDIKLEQTNFTDLRELAIPRQPTNND